MWASPVSPRHADPRCTGTGSSPPSRQMVQHGGCTHTSVAGHHRHGHQLFVAVDGGRKNILMLGDVF